MVDKVGTGTGFFLQILRFSHVCIVPSVFLARLHLHVAPIRRTNGRSLGTVQKAELFGNREAMNRNYFHFFFVFKR